MTRTARRTGAASEERLIVALDFPTPKDAKAMVEALGESVSFYKIGMELAYGGGLPLAQELAESGRQDLKLHDIPSRDAATKRFAG